MNSPDQVAGRPPAGAERGVAAATGPGYAGAVSPSDPADIPYRHWARWSLIPLAVTLVLDQASKWYLQSRIPNGAFTGVERPEHWPAWLTWHHNRGVAWGMFDQWPWLVMALTAVLIPVLAVMWWRTWRVSLWTNLACGMVLGGALGNAIDRLLSKTGHLAGVRDFIHIDLGVWPANPWPTFNIADSAICVGVILLILAGLRRPPPAATESHPT